MKLITSLQHIALLGSISLLSGWKSGWDNIHFRLWVLLLCNYQNQPSGQFNLYFWGSLKQWEFWIQEKSLEVFKGLLVGWCLLHAMFGGEGNMKIWQMILVKNKMHSLELRPNCAIYVSTNILFDFLRKFPFLHIDIRGHKRCQRIICHWKGMVAD